MDMWLLNVFEVCGNRRGRKTYVLFDMMNRGAELAYILVCEKFFHIHNAGIVGRKTYSDKQL